MSPKQLEAAETTLRRGTWAITAGAVLFSVLTVTPLVERVTPAGWDWTAPILPIVVDTAVVIVVRLDSTVSRLGGSTKGWPAVLRWLTGVFTLLLNIGDSALKRDLVGVAVHAVAPLLLIVTAEAGLTYRRRIAEALERLERSRREEEERSREQQRADRERERLEREREQQRREAAAREAREHAEQLERERLDREDRRAREEREHTAALERERADREAQQRREEQQRADRERAERLEREQQERARAERERRERETAERAAHEQREREARERAAARREQSESRAVNSDERPALTAVPVNDDRSKMVEPAAREHVRVGERAGKSVRQLAEETGWSVGWVSARLREQRAQSVAIVPAAAGGGQR